MLKIIRYSLEDQFKYTGKIPSRYTYCSVLTCNPIFNDYFMSQPFVVNLTAEQVTKLNREIRTQEFSFSTPEYTQFSAKRKGLSCTLYTSGKLVVQGKEESVKEWIEFFLEPEILQQFTYSHAKEFLDLSPRIGVDESGKGDVFGPLCVAGLYAEGKEIQALHTLGVVDSKTLNEKAIRRIGNAIRRDFKTYVMRFQPTTYNSLYERFNNLNRMLAWAHGTVIAELSRRTGSPSAIIDQFTKQPLVANVLKAKGVSIALTQRVRAESDPIVAGASIVARLGFIEGIEELEQQFGQKLPKGASSACIEAGRQLVKVHGEEALNAVAKMHFKTLDAIRRKE